MIAPRNALVFVLAAAALAVAGCERIVTGEAVQTLAVSENEAGGYGPVTLTLSPEMAPVAINFHARHGDDPSEFDKWNGYRATLSRNGQAVVSGQFNLNHTGSVDSPQGSRYLLQNMLMLNPGEAGDYELVITPTKPAEMKLYETQVEVRRNVQDSYAVYPEQPATQRTLSQ